MNNEVRTRSRVRPKAPMYKLIFDAAQADNTRENRRINRQRTRVRTGTLGSRRIRHRDTRTMSRLMPHRAAISKKPLRAYSAGVKPWGRMPPKALKK